MWARAIIMGLVGAGLWLTNGLIFAEDLSLPPRTVELVGSSELCHQIDRLLGLTTDRPPVDTLDADTLAATVTEPELKPELEPDGKRLRRLSLDLRGVVPTREELDAFVADPHEDRWKHWVERFLQDPLAEEHLVNFLDRTLMLRRPHTQVDRASWISYLRDHVSADTALDTLSRELLYSPWWNQDQRASQRFYLDRAGDPHLTTRDLARVFLGRDLQCAQCHDHPLVDDYRQIDYQGLFAFVSAGSLQEVAYKDAEGKDQKVMLYTEKPAGDAPFESVFDRGKSLRSGPRLPGQIEDILEYERPDQRSLDQSPLDSITGVPIPPKTSRRRQLAMKLADRSNGEFVANWANRLWAHVFGRGLVHPVDMIEPNNPPLNPELYQLISSGLVQCDMQVKPFLRQLVLSDAYRFGFRSSIDCKVTQPDDLQIDDLNSDLRGESIRRRLAKANAELTSLIAADQSQLQDYGSARAAWIGILANRTAIHGELDTAEAALLDAKKKLDEAGAAVVESKKNVELAQTRASLLDESKTQLTLAMMLLGDEDKELSQAMAIIEQRLETARANVAEKEQAIAATEDLLIGAKNALEQTVSRVDEVVQRLKPVQTELMSVDQTMTVARKSWSDARAAVVAARRRVTELERRAEGHSPPASDPDLHPLTAEQLCWSTLRVTGVLDAYVATELAELEKQSPLAADADQAAQFIRRRQAVRQAIEKLRGIADQYVALYSSGPDKSQDDFFASADQALYIANGGSVFSWAGPGNQNPTQYAISLTEASEIARVLYWSYLCRYPTEQETALVAELIDTAGDQRNAVIHEMAWGLISAAEFRFTR